MFERVIFALDELLGRSGQTDEYFERQVNYLMKLPDVRAQARALSAASGYVAKQSHEWNPVRLEAIHRLRTRS